MENEEYIAKPRSWYLKLEIMLKISGENSKEKVAKEIHEALEESKEKVINGQIQAHINEQNEMILE
jgi:basic membrane lipoprotein Med (substrate-binding protein (PBP1-ABC) superfamily)